MATAAEAQALMQAVACAYCVLPPGLVPYVEIILFRKGGSMATTAEVQALIADAECLRCTITEGVVGYALLAALLDLVNSEPVPEDPQNLLDQTVCLMCIPSGLLPYVTLNAVANLP